MSKIRKAYFIDASYTVRNGQTYVSLLVKGKDTVRLYYRYDPYFLIDMPSERMDDLLNIKALRKDGRIAEPIHVEEVQKNVGMESRTMVKLYCKEPADVPAVKHQIPFKCYEYSIPFSRRFMFDMQLSPFDLISYEREGRLIKKIRSIKEPEEPMKLDALAFDIETYNPVGLPREEKDPVIMISYNGKEKGVITSKQSKHGFVEKVDGEKEILERFDSIVENENPDVLFGYNSANFDLPYLTTRARRTNARFNLARFRGKMKALKKGLINGYEIEGRVHFDLYPVARLFGFIGLIKAQKFTLNAVAEEVLGKEKIAISKDNMWQLWDSGEIDKLAEYSMVDAELAYELGQNFLPLEMEMSSTAKMPLFQTTLSTSGQLVENLLMFNAAKRKELIPPRPSGGTVTERLAAPIEGAFVKIPEPGIYENLAVLDFRGLYPSIIISYNIDPGTLMKEEEEGDAHISPTGARFSKKAMGLVPFVLDYLVDARVVIKKQLKTLDKSSKEYVKVNARSHSLKILSNSFYGYLGYARSRYYSRPCAESVTAWGRKHITETIEKAEKTGFEVIYGDSLPYDRHIFIKDKSGFIKLLKIGDFVRENKNNPEICEFKTLAFDGTKVVFKSITRAIEHPYSAARKGNLLKFVTTHGSTVVTPQHSVYFFDEKNREIKLADAKDLKIGDKLVSLTNPPVSEIFVEGKEIDALDLEVGPYKDQLRIYNDNLQFPASMKGKCPYCGRIGSLYSHISVKHSDRKLTIDKGKKTDYGYIGGKNAKTGRIPRFWKLTKELAWIMGYYAADGSASERSKVHNKAMVSFGSQDKKIIERVKRFFDGIFGENFKMIVDYDKRIKKKMYYYRVQRLPLVALFKYGFDLGNKSTGKRVPWFIFSAEEKIRRAFLDGYLEGDGTTYQDKRYRTHFIKFSTKSKELAIGLQYLLKSGKHDHTAFLRGIKHVYWLYRKDKPGIQSLRLQSAKRDLMDFENFCLARIKKIEEIKDPIETVFDLEVEGEHNFVDAEGMLLVHNTDSLFLLNKNRNDVLKFINEVNAELPEKMELELEGFYNRGVFVSKKGGEGKGAKKKYALMGEDGRIKIRGFELVRRDWSDIAKETQLKVLEAILKEGSKEKAVKIVRDTISDLEKGKVPLEKLAISTQLNKDPHSYEVKSPELSAAKKMLQANIPVEKGTMISYVVGKKGASISEKAVPLELAKDYDTDYYVNNQVLPSVMKILKELGYDEYSMKVGGKQKSLDQYF